MQVVKCAKLCGNVVVEVIVLCKQNNWEFLTLYDIIIIFKKMCFTFGALTLLVWRQEGHPACKKLGIGLLVTI